MLDEVRHLSNAGSVVTVARTTFILSYEFAYEQWNLIRAESQVVQHALVNRLHFLWPVRLHIVRTSLMQQDTLDDTISLGNFGHVDQALIRVVVVSLEIVDEP